MANRVVLFRCLVISPSDVRNERDAIRDTVHQWNSQIGEVLGAHLEPVLWESHSVPEVGEEPQRILNRQIVEQCDLGIAVFWSRLGTPTSEYLSGSLEEIAKLSARKAPVMVYFCERPIPQEIIDTQQIGELRKAKENLRSQALVSFYQDTAQLTQDLLRHLTTRVSKLIEVGGNATTGNGMKAEEVLTAPRPDVRVRVIAMWAISGTRHVDALTVAVENHSPVPVYHSSISLELDDGSGLWTPGDFLTGQPNQAIRISPGDKYTFNFDPKRLEAQQISRIRCAVATDSIGREYRSDPEETRAALARAVK